MREMAMVLRVEKREKGEEEWVAVREGKKEKERRRFCKEKIKTPTPKSLEAILDCTFKEQFYTYEAHSKFSVEKEGHGIGQKRHPSE
ncbi:hypothetical protein VNO78_15523 [Psophocarpus tetragonolobus]|uniref:Uncharacterized protein n=1 Tax=Psophocarpus tetragonolobus TaxID=3891 RepID=A0AAN9SK70_PSOTE